VEDILTGEQQADHEAPGERSEHTGNADRHQEADQFLHRFPPGALSVSVEALIEDVIARGAKQSRLPAHALADRFHFRASVRWRTPTVTPPSGRRRRRTRRRS